MQRLLAARLDLVCTDGNRSRTLRDKARWYSRRRCIPLIDVGEGATSSSAALINFAQVLSLVEVNAPRSRCGWCVCTLYKRAGARPQARSGCHPTMRWATIGQIATAKTAGAALNPMGFYP